jgi:hypothetical protein
VVEGVGHGDAVVEIPGSFAGAGFLGKLVEEGVFAVVRRPDGDIAVPGDAALSDFPEEPGVGVFGKFVEADIAAIDGHSLGVGREGNNAGASVKFYDTDFNFFGERGGAAMFVEAREFEVFFAVGEDGAGEVEEVGEGIDLVHVFEGTGEVFGGEEVIALLEEEAFADVFEAIAKGPADPDGFFGEGVHLLTLGVEGVFGQDPVNLVRGEMAGEVGFRIEFEGWENGGHRMVEGWWLRVEGRKANEWMIGLVD